MRIVSARTAAHWRSARELVEEYVDSLGADLTFQNYETEIADLPAQYGGLTARMLLAEVGDDIVGCVGLRSLDAEVCEMKRLYVRPGFLGRGIGRALAETIVGDARQLGYVRMRLDTWPSMTAAQALYRHLGFEEIPAYRYNPEKRACFMELQLRPRFARDR